MRIALDANVLAYAEGVNGAERQADAGRILRDLAEDELVIPAQALAELFTLLTRKARRPVAEVRAAVLGWHDACLVAETSSGVLLDAMELVVSHQFAPWDAIMLAAAAASGCRLLLSEDMQDGFMLAGGDDPQPVCRPDRSFGVNSGTSAPPTPSFHGLDILFEQKFQIDIHGLISHPACTLRKQKHRSQTIEKRITCQRGTDLCRWKAPDGREEPRICAFRATLGGNQPPKNKVAADNPQSF